MKKSILTTLLLLVMFISAQIIGLVVIDSYSPVKVIEGQKINVSAPDVPFFQTPQPETSYDFLEIFVSLIFSFTLVTFFVFILIKYKSETFFRIWYLLVVILAISVVLNLAFIEIRYSKYIAFSFAIVLAYFKIYQRNLIVHNFTELLIYPGVAAAFVPLLNPITVIFLLIAISIYDLWAVWKSGIMQKMAKYQINKLKIFSGFLIPNLTNVQKSSVKKMSKEEKIGKKVKIGVAILGGGDVVFPIITAGVFLRNFGIASSWFILLGATLGLSYIFFFGESKKPYPAMPYITSGILLGLLCWGIFNSLI
jgi:presenilin-like A22 family membrane protease